MKRVSAFLFLLSAATSIEAAGGGTSSSDGDPCVTPTGDTGICIPWKECSRYAQYVISGRDDPVQEAFLRERVCKLDPPNVSLCCPGDSPTKTMIPTGDECGKPVKVSSNEPGAWPWLAAIGRLHPIQGFSVVCAGTLITKRHVLSAASCFSNAEKPGIVRLGEYHLDNNIRGEKPEDYSIILFSTDQYNSVTFENDIIILPLDRDVIFSDYIQPACLPFPFRNNEFVGEHLDVVGWGKPDFGASESTKIPVAGKVPVVDRNDCIRAYSSLKGASVNEKHICAGDAFSDACQGDGGAPLNYYNPKNDRYYVVGIVSFGVGCAHSEFPGIYTRVSSFLDWISGSIN